MAIRKPIPKQAFEVLQYWFLELQPADWFSSSSEIDAEIASRFAKTLDEAAAGTLDHWAETPQGLLALVIVLDQFSRNIHRGSGEAFANDAKAQALTLQAIETGADAKLGMNERHFLYMPLMHAEDLKMQDMGIAKYESLAETAAGVTGFCVHHRDIIAQFGRFPYRNAALNRASSAEEQAFLDKEGNPFA
ncbi:MAG: DUF924 family protein [Pseudomonadota bacterium]